jgi:hypothetical protein
MRTLTIPGVPDEVVVRLEKLAAEAGLPLSTFVLQELVEVSRRADAAELLSALPSLPIDRATILEARADSFFLDGPTVSDEVLTERASQEQAEREPF